MLRWVSWKPSQRALEDSRRTAMRQHGKRQSKSQDFKANIVFFDVFRILFRIVSFCEVMSALVPRIKKLVFENKELMVSKAMRDAMKGTCITQDEYRTSDKPFSDFWQCASEDHDNFGAGAYCPSERVINSLSEYTGVSKRTFSKFHLRSNNESDALYGKWCGMPAPPEYEHPYGGPVGARVFWED